MSTPADTTPTGDRKVAVIPFPLPYHSRQKALGRTLIDGKTKEWELNRAFANLVVDALELDYGIDTDLIDEYRGAGPQGSGVKRMWVCDYIAEHGIRAAIIIKMSYAGVAKKGFAYTHHPDMPMLYPICQRFAKLHTDRLPDAHPHKKAGALPDFCHDDPISRDPRFMAIRCNPVHINHPPEWNYLHENIQAHVDTVAAGTEFFLSKLDDLFEALKIFEGLKEG